MESSLVTTSAPTCTRVTMLLDLRAFDSAGISLHFVQSSATLRRFHSHFRASLSEGGAISESRVTEFPDRDSFRAVTEFAAAQTERTCVAVFYIVHLVAHCVGAFISRLTGGPITPEQVAAFPTPRHTASQA